MIVKSFCTIIKGVSYPLDHNHIPAKLKTIPSASVLPYLSSLENISMLIYMKWTDMVYIKPVSKLYFRTVILSTAA